MKSLIWKWGFPEHQILEKDFQNLKTKLFEQWKIQSKDLKTSRPNIIINDISDKQKDAIRDIFAHISIKRVLFQNEKRLYFSLGQYWSKYKAIDSETKIADVILYPIQNKEIQDILSQAQQSDISIRVFNQCNEHAVSNFPKNKILGIVNVEMMHKIIRFEPEQFQITVQAGIKANVLQIYLNEAGWDLNFDIIGQEHLNILELIQNHLQIQSSILQAQIHTPMGMLIASRDNGYLQQYFNDFTLGIPSEITLKIQVKANYLRKIDAQFNNFKDIISLIQKLNHNNIIVNNLNIIHSNSNTLVDNIDFTKKPEESPKYFINSFIKKSEEILFKDETERPIYISLEFQEYQFSISSLLLKVKEIIQNSDGKLVTLPFKEKIDEWENKFPYFESDAGENQIDCLHASMLIPLSKMEDYEKAIKKKLEKNNFYSSKKSDYIIYFSHLDTDGIQIHFYFFAATQYRKSEDAFLQVSTYFKKLLSNEKSDAHIDDKIACVNGEIYNHLKNLTDPKGILSSKKLNSISFTPKKN